MLTSKPEKEYHDFLSQGKFMIQRSRSSGKYVFFPRIAEPVSGRQDLEWVEASGRGTVYSATVVRPKPPALPYNVVLVDLVEGPRIMSRVDGIAADAVRIGQLVKAQLIDEQDGRLLVFVPVSDSVGEP